MGQPIRGMNSRVLTTGARLRSSAMDFVKTQFETKIASELWLNIAGKDYRLVGKMIRIGRAPDNDIVIDHKSVSRYHALLTLKDGQATLEDLKSRNGIVVNGSVMDRAELCDSDAIKIGDLVGLFFIRHRKTTESKAAKKLTDNIMQWFGSGTSLVARFQALESPQKKKVVAAAVISLGLLGLIVSSGNQSTSSLEADMSSPHAALASVEFDRKAFERCLEREDLGNFRQAYECFRKLPPAAEVQGALARVIKRQSDLVEQRFKEGTRAFENYYYDIAILKWQEVLLVASDDSEYRTKSMAGIEKAEERKKLR